MQFPWIYHNKIVHTIQNLPHTIQNLPHSIFPYCWFLAHSLFPIATAAIPSALSSGHRHYTRKLAEKEHPIISAV